MMDMDQDTQAIHDEIVAVARADLREGSGEVRPPYTRYLAGPASLNASELRALWLVAEADRAEAEARALYWEGEADRARAVVRDETREEFTRNLQRAYDGERAAIQDSNMLGLKVSKYQSLLKVETKSRDFWRGATLLFSAAAVVSFAINVGWL